MKKITVLAEGETYKLSAIFRGHIRGKLSISPKTEDGVWTEM